MVDQGFSAQWTSTKRLSDATRPRPEPMMLEESEGNFSHGSCSGGLGTEVEGYAPDSFCVFVIRARDYAPAKTTLVSLAFAFLDTEAQHDFVFVNQCEDPDCSATTELAQLSGSLDMAGRQYLSATGVLQLICFADASDVTHRGFAGTLPKKRHHQYH